MSFMPPGELLGSTIVKSLLVFVFLGGCALVGVAVSYLEEASQNTGHGGERGR